MKNIDTILEKMALKDYTEFSKLVSDAYQARPAFESEYVSSWEALAEHNEKMFKQISTKVKIEFTAEDPYKNFDELKQDIETNNTMKIYTGHSDHPVWTPEQNQKFRAVHDYMIHVAGDHPFTLRGEMGAYNRHIKTAPESARLALFTEVVGQVCTNIETGSFPEQKICKLWGFNYTSVGEVDEEEYTKNFPDKEENMKNNIDKVLSEYFYGEEGSMRDQLDDIYEGIHAMKEKLDKAHDSMEGHLAVYASQAVNFFDRGLEEIQKMKSKLDMESIP